MQTSCKKRRFPSSGEDLSDLREYSYPVLRTNVASLRRLEGEKKDPLDTNASQGGIFSKGSPFQGRDQKQIKHENEARFRNSLSLRSTRPRGLASKGERAQSRKGRKALSHREIAHRSFCR